MSAQPQTKLSDEEYLVIERAADFKSEFYNGEMFAMSGGSPGHALLGGAICAEFRTALKGSGCRSYNSDLRVRVARGGLYAYPDATVICGDLEYADGTTDVVTNPTVVVEVLSPSTEAYDRGFKSSEYRKIASLKEYAFLSQSEPRVEVYSRNDNGEWGVFSESVGLDAVCHFRSLDCAIRLADIYADFSFPI